MRYTLGTNLCATAKVKLVNFKLKNDNNTPPLAPHTTCTIISKLRPGIYESIAKRNYLKISVRERGI